ncbi:MAG: JAB domain-containing protein [Lachnospiraceae bacterium]|nr:JAB domain-containing protein [Lachnospiraceae bacterium]
MVDIDVVRIELVKETTIRYEKQSIKTPEEAVKLMASFFRYADREKIYVCVCNTAMHPINISMVAMGGMKQCIVSIPEIFKTAILSNCSNIIVFHNHPSGKVTPSEEDKRITKRIQQAGQILDIILQDHIIIGEDTFFSFKQAGLL